MKLFDYRKLRGITRRVAARELGVTEGSFYRWECGRMPQPNDIIKIRNWSAGAVTADDLMAQYEAARQAASA